MYLLTRFLTPLTVTLRPLNLCGGKTRRRHTSVHSSDIIAIYHRNLLKYPGHLCTVQSPLTDTSQQQTLFGGREHFYQFLMGKTPNNGHSQKQTLFGKEGYFHQFFFFMGKAPNNGHSQ
jgi:hypothetical protein